MGLYFFTQDTFAENGYIDLKPVSQNPIVPQVLLDISKK